INGVRQTLARHLPLLGAERAGEKGRQNGADGAQGDPGSLIASGVTAHAVRDDDEGELMILVQVRPGQMLHEETVFVPIALAPDRSHASDVQTERASGAWDRLRRGWFVGERRWLDGEGLAALVALDRNPEMLLRDLTGRYAVRAVGLNGHDNSSAGA